MGFFTLLALVALLQGHSPIVLAACNVRSVQVATADAQSQAIQAINSAFASCTQCPCQVRVRSLAKVVADSSSSAIVQDSVERRSGNCDRGGVNATATAVAGDAAGDIATASSDGLSQACGGNVASSEADAIRIGLGDAAARAAAATAAGGGSTATTAQSEISGQLEGTLTQSLSTAVAKCKCGGGASGGAGPASGKGGNKSAPSCPPGLSRQGRC